MSNEPENTRNQPAPSLSRTITVAGTEFAFDPDGTLLINNDASMPNPVWATRQEAQSLLEFLQRNLEEPRSHARSTLRPFFDRPTTRGIDR